MSFHRRPGKNAGISVFYDKTGRRVFKVIGSLLTCLVLLSGLTYWLVPQLIAPVGYASGSFGLPPSTHQAAAVAVPLGQQLPVLGNDSLGSLIRVDGILRQNGTTYLTDPISGQQLRPASEDETDTIGSADFVIEHFGQPADRQLMLTFDDGPDAVYTPQILDILSHEHVPATFFVVGQQIVASPEVMARITREGHMVGNHTATHSELSPSDPSWNQIELTAADRLIRAAGHYATKLWRLPYGDPEKKPQALLLGQQLGYTQVDFDLDTNDWRFEAQDQNIPLPELDGKGHVVLMHDAGGNRQATITMLQRFISEAKAKGYSFSTLAPLLGQADTPQQNIEPSIADTATYAIAWTALSLPELMLKWLLWLAVGTMSFKVLLDIFLAIHYNHSHPKRLAAMAKSGQGWASLPKKISVLIPAHNEGEVIDRTLEALMETNSPIPIEYLVIVNGSTDDTLVRARFFAKLYPDRVRVLYRHRPGKAAAQRYGIKMATGDVIIFLDGDTIFEPETISYLVENFRDPRVGAVSGQVKVGNRHGLLPVWQSLDYVSGALTRLAEAQLRASSVIPGAISAWRKNVLELAGNLSDDTMAEDADLTVQAQRLGWRVAYEPRAVAWTEVPHKIRALAKQRLRWFYGHVQVYRKHWDVLLRPQYGALGMLVMPYAVMTTLVPMVFMPLMLITGAISLANGNWMSLIIFSAFIATLHMVVLVTAVILLRERLWHLPAVLIYRPIYEVLRIFLLYATLFRIISGREFEWGILRRYNSVKIRKDNDKSSPQVQVEEMLPQS